MSRRNLIRATDKVDPGFFERLFRTLEGIMDGRTRNYGTFTLTENTTTTTVNDARFESQQSVVWAPTTSNAAGAMTNLYVSARANGSFTLTHANTATTDRTFLYIITG